MDSWKIHRENGLGPNYQVFSESLLAPDLRWKVSVCCALDSGDTLFRLVVALGAGYRFETVLDKRQDGTQTLFGSAAASRQIDD